MTIQELQAVSELIAMDAIAKVDRGEIDVADYEAFSYGPEIISAALMAEVTR